MTRRHVRFLLRWVVFYNAELVWLAWRLPRHVDPGAALPPGDDRRRREAHRLLAGATASCTRACASCGRCCLESVDRFTPFDAIVRRATPAPAPSESRRIYSLPWMVWNAVWHGAQRLLPEERRPRVTPCPHLAADGCRLPREDRPMICVSWFCPQAVLAMSPVDMDAAEPHLRQIEALHRQALRAARSYRKN